MVVAPPRVKPCPTCRRALPPNATRCEYCLTDVRHAKVLSAEETARFLNDPPVVRRRTAVRLRRPGVRGVLGIVLLLLAALTAWSAYDHFIARPGALPGPSATTRSVAPATEGWPAPHGDLRGTRSTSVRPALDARVTWEHDLPAKPVAPPVADGQALYFALTDNRVVAVDTGDGHERWSYEAGPALWSAPVVAGDRVYVAMRGGHVIALDARNGTAAWRTNTPLNLFVSPLVADGVVYAFGPEAIAGLDAEDGRMLWSVATGSNWAVLPPVVAGKWLVVASSDAVLVFNRATGKRTYEFPQTDNVGLVVLDEGHVISVSPRFASAFDPASTLPWWEGARPVWDWLWVLGGAPRPPARPREWITTVAPSDEHPAVAATRTFAPALADEQLVVASQDGLVRAFEARTGSLAWEQHLPPITGAPVATAAGVLLVTREGLTLRGPDGAEVASRALPAEGARSAVLTSRGLYLTSDSGHIVALQ